MAGIKKAYTLNARFLSQLPRPFRAFIDRTEQKQLHNNLKSVKKMEPDR